MQYINDIELERDFNLGLEIELSDVDRSISLPMGMSWAKKEHDIVNSDGRAIIPGSKEYTIGGEVNTPPSYSFEEQAQYLNELWKLFPNASVNHRAHTHCHIAFEGLKEDVEIQKKILKYAVENSRYCLDYFFTPVKTKEMNFSAWKYQIEDRTIMPEWRYKFCMQAKNPMEFKIAHQMAKNGEVFPQITKRYAVNTFSIYKHGTVEFRCFFPTMKTEEIIDCLKFCTLFINEALKEHPKPIQEAVNFEEFNFPKSIPFSYELEMGWQATKVKK